MPDKIKYIPAYAKYSAKLAELLRKEDPLNTEEQTVENALLILQWG